ncbi:MAG TPA: hypothetical protein VF407_24650 [Polyangiaceae bacterium]
MRTKTARRLLLVVGLAFFASASGCSCTTGESRRERREDRQVEKDQKKLQKDEEKRDDN